MMRPHSTPWGGKRCACDGASQIVIGIAVAAGKMRTGEAKDGVNLDQRACPARAGVWRPKNLRCSNPAAESVPEYAIAAYSFGRS